jgi:hypothetical protein
VWCAGARVHPVGSSVPANRLGAMRRNPSGSQHLERCSTLSSLGRHLAVRVHYQRGF